MKYSINAPINDLDDKVILVPTGDALTEPQHTPLTYGEVIFRSVLNVDPKDDDTKKFEAYQLASKARAAMRGDGELTLSTKEADLVRKAAAKTWQVVVYGRLVEFLDAARS